VPFWSDNIIFSSVSTLSFQRHSTATDQSCERPTADFYLCPGVGLLQIPGKASVASLDVVLAPAPSPIPSRLRECLWMLLVRATDGIPVYHFNLAPSPKRCRRCLYSTTGFARRCSFRFRSLVRAPFLPVAFQPLTSFSNNASATLQDVDASDVNESCTVHPMQGEKEGPPQRRYAAPSTRFRCAIDAMAIATRLRLPELARRAHYAPRFQPPPIKLRNASTCLCSLVQHVETLGDEPTVH
jgi:hypothetical protein